MANQGRGRQSKYQQIADELRTAIQDGQYGPGARLPGENDLMAAYEVARMTARQALGVLQSEGLTEPRKGAGVFVKDAKQREGQRSPDTPSPIPADEPVVCNECARAVALGWWGGISRHAPTQGEPLCVLCLEGAAAHTAHEWVSMAAALVQQRDREGQRRTPGEDALRGLGIN